MTVQELIADISGAGSVAEEVLQLLEGLDPELAIPAEILAKVLPLLTNYILKAATAFSNASGTPITVETIMALLPADPNPLTLPVQ